MGRRRLLCGLCAGLAVLVAGQAWAQAPRESAPQRSPEAALSAVAVHLSPPHALYLYESLTRQVLTNEAILEQPQNPRLPLANDSLWALDVMSNSILVERQDGPSLDVRLAPTFFTDIVRRYMNRAHYWPDREITPQTRREHLAAWYALYLMLLVGNTTQDEMAATLRGGAFERAPEGLEAGGPSLVDKLKRDKVLAEEAYKLVHIRRGGPEGQEVLVFPAYMDQWKDKIYAAYGVK
jgi:hypothetical protein